MRKFFLVAATSLAVAACNPVAQIGEADSQIDQFHEHYAAQDSAAIYAMTAPEFREVTSEAEWAAIMGHTYQVLGPVADSSQTSFNINTNNGVTTTVVVRDTTFANDEGTETFTFFGTGEGMALGGYNVQADALIGTTIEMPTPADSAPPTGKPEAPTGK
jgi:hypothetical protein